MRVRSKWVHWGQKYIFLIGGIEEFAESLWGFIWESGGFVMSLPVVYMKHNFLFLEFVQAGAFVQTLQLYVFEFSCILSSV